MFVVGSELLFELKHQGKLSLLAASNITFINIFDLGMNKTVFEILALISTSFKRMIQLNAISLSHYGTTDVLCKITTLHV